MKRDFTNENMEEFLRENAEALRMRPTARVWKGISSHLTRRRRKLGLILGTSLLFTTALVYYLATERPSQFTSADTNTNSTQEQRTQLSDLTKNIAPLQKQVAFTDSRKNQPVISVPVNPNNKELQFIAESLSPSQETSQNLFSGSIVDSYGENILTAPTAGSELEDIPASDPMSIESVVNSFKPTMKRKLGWQMYFTPTVSYRKLSDNYVDNVAVHKPGFGFEMGVAAKYPVTKAVKVRAGLQFNVARYGIKTFDSYSQPATIRINDGNRVNYVNTVTNYNNFSGYKSTWLQNFYLQVSAPVGVEFKLKGDEKVQFGIATTIQPTYLVGDRAYFISSDYKNYAEMPRLVRKWNANTSLETFVGYSTGHLNWQVGPQVRYQILSSYLQKYPIKENMFDFGLKVGISLNK